ncbi:hypothetical protein M3E13_15510 [Oceanobacillus kimchii]|uniref:hypothetical protein n=1 Tax=Oceanobacillus kimchii TaxID=746691 RepID=UPI0021A35DB9|nr:hypothetical protein [Oceanobacillus kimchii]MCT1575672.1 hypothetical protein [Oceanobacillus kimchii]MCT2137303.1 hypothetical protein [Oceanobacillus kimchii]
MRADKFIKLGSALEKIIPSEKTKLDKWVSHDGYEEIVIIDNDGDKYEIKFYPNSN